MGVTSDSVIRIGHGGGGSLTQRLLEDVFLPVLGNDALNALDDSAVLETDGSRLAFTTDSFVVQPIFFPGGDIGRLAVCGTVNDLAMVGALPRFISAGFILEEGLPLADLRRIVRSVREAADEAEVAVCAGDTKVVERGSADRLFINTSGIGVIRGKRAVTGAGAMPGDRVLVSGPLGRHGMAVATSREEFGFASRIVSDVAPLNHLVHGMMRSAEVHAMRDATRGGLATVLNEIAARSGVIIHLEESAIPVTDEVKGACELLGFDVLYLANEGVFTACVAPASAEDALKALRRHPYGRDAALIGTVLPGKKGHAAPVILKTTVGSSRILPLLSGEQLPRIC